MTKTENLNPAEAAKAMLEGNFVADKYGNPHAFRGDGMVVFWHRHEWHPTEFRNSGAPYKIVPDPSKPVPKPVPRVITSMDELEGFTGHIEVSNIYTRRTHQFALEGGEFFHMAEVITTQHALSNDGWTVTVVREDV